jgi:hypothetical protein
MASQPTFSLTQMWHSGRSAWRSSQVAIETPIRAGGSLGAANIGAPQRAQESRSIRGELGHAVVSPDRSNAPDAKIARAKNGAPVARWQSRQWQTRTFSGAAVARHRTCPHRQPPS